MLKELSSWIVSNANLGMDCDAIAVDQFSQDFATFKAEVLNQLIENPAQGWVPLHATCQFECILVAHQGEQALGMKGCEP